MRARYFSKKGNPRMSENFDMDLIDVAASLSRRGSPHAHGAATSKRGMGCSFLP